MDREERVRNILHYLSINISFEPYFFWSWRNISTGRSFEPCFASQLFWSSQVDKEAAETGVEGFAGRPLRLWLPHLQAARRPHGGHGGDHLADAGRELADLPWSVEIVEGAPDILLLANCVDGFPIYLTPRIPNSSSPARLRCVGHTAWAPEGPLPRSWAPEGPLDF